MGGGVGLWSAIVRISCYRKGEKRREVASRVEISRDSTGDEGESREKESKEKIWWIILEVDTPGKWVKLDWLLTR